MTLDEAIIHAEEVAQGQSELYDCYLQHGEQGEHVESYKKCASDHRQLAEWLKDYKRLKEQAKWIPVSERLPEENGQYLITVKYKHVNDSYEDVYAEHGEWSDGRWDMCFGHCGEVEDIIAWMPLPQPYKAESEE
jgi:hypothetical protein